MTLTTKKPVICRFRILAVNVSKVTHIRIGAGKCYLSDGNLNLPYIQKVAAAMLRRRFGVKVEPDTINVVPVQDLPPERSSSKYYRKGESWCDRYW